MTKNKNAKCKCKRKIEIDDFFQHYYDNHDEEIVKNIKFDKIKEDVIEYLRGETTKDELIFSIEAAIELAAQKVMDGNDYPCECDNSKSKNE